MELVTLDIKQKTDGSVLSQLNPLEVQAADTPGQVRNGPAHTAGVQHGRGKSERIASLSASPAKAEIGVSRVFVLDRNKKPLMPCKPVRARLLLKKGKARVHRLMPFTIRLINRLGGEVQPIRLKYDPGAKVTGVAVVREQNLVQHVVHLAELSHRGQVVKKHMKQRAAYRRRRRSANLRYREPRFNNRTKPKGWLPPSLQSRVDNILSWTNRYRKLCPVSSISVERVRFDTQKLANPEISGVEYQQGELLGYEIREYLLERWGRKCAYCSKENVRLEIEHIVPKSRNGTNRISNLTLACRACNKKKGNRNVKEFLATKPNILAAILKKAKQPLRDVAAVNATRNAIYFGLKNNGLPVEASTGGRTKYNRERLRIPKTHALDAVCVGCVENALGWVQKVLFITATGRGSYRRTQVDKYGFPRGYSMRKKQVRGFKTGDLVSAKVPKGKKVGKYFGKIAVRASGSFNIKEIGSVVQGISWKYCKLLQRADGYSYNLQVFPHLPEREVLQAERNTL